MATAKPMPIKQQLPVTAQVHSQPPAKAATQATKGGPKNCPVADHCCIHPTVVDSVSGLGAKRMASANKVPGIKPPTDESKMTDT
jgi:ADP-glucose pyrophosphorylase